MLSGEPFTMEELKRAFSKNENEARNIENRLREFHRLGYIKPQRQQYNSALWKRGSAGR